MKYLAVKGLNRGFKYIRYENLCMEGFSHNIEAGLT